MGDKNKKKSTCLVKVTTSGSRLHTKRIESLQDQEGHAAWHILTAVICQSRLGKLWFCPIWNTVVSPPHKHISPKDCFVQEIH